MKVEITIIPAAQEANKTKEFTFQEELDTDSFVPIAVEIGINSQLDRGDDMNAFMFHGEFYAWRKM